MRQPIKAPVAILGYGTEGKAALEYLLKQGITNITVCDENDFTVPVSSEKAINFQLGKNAFHGLEDFSTVIRSPGIKYNREEIKTARDAGAYITSMTDISMQIAKERITAITGSNGKTTTSALVGEILKKYYKNKIIIGGNDREPVAQRATDNSNWPIVMEVSSFQFADINNSPHISVILNITPNHLDWHDNLQDYINAKNNLIKHQNKNDWAVLNANNEDSSKMASGVQSKIFWIGEQRGNNWADWINDNIVINDEIITNIQNIKVKTHPDNLLFATAIASIHNVPSKLIADVIANFKGVEHRIEFVKTVNQISFYNDSSCTTPESTEVALEQFKPGKLIILLGGSSKKADFSFLASRIISNKVRVVIYGEEGTKIKQAIEEAGGENLILKHDTSGNFSSIIQETFHMANPDDNIVLSPACASFDMFKNSKERGNQFKEIVRKI